MKMNVKLKFYAHFNPPDLESPCHGKSFANSIKISAVNFHRSNIGSDGKFCEVDFM